MQQFELPRTGYQQQNTQLTVNPGLQQYLGWDPSKSTPAPMAPTGNPAFNPSNPGVNPGNNGGLNTEQNQNQLAKSWGEMGFGNKVNMVFGGLKTLGSLYASIKQIGMAEKQLAQQREQWNKTWGMAVNQHNEALNVRAANRFNQNRALAQKQYDAYKVEK